MYYYRARYYSPTLGRFLQTDPIGYQDDVNLDTYVYNDPLNSTDPTGEDCVQGVGTTCPPVEPTEEVVVTASHAPALPFPLTPPARPIPKIRIGVTPLASATVLLQFVFEACGDSPCAQHTNMMSKKFKVPKKGISKKEGAKDVPSWAKGNRPYVGESGKEFADRLCDEKYGKGNYDKRTGSEHSKIQKWGDRAFEDPK